MSGLGAMIPRPEGRLLLKFRMLQARYKAQRSRFPLFLLPAAVLCAFARYRRLSLARSFHSAQGLPVRAREQGQDRQGVQLSIALVLGFSSTSPFRPCLPLGYFALIVRTPN